MVEYMRKTSNNIYKSTHNTSATNTDMIHATTRNSASTHHSSYTLLKNNRYHSTTITVSPALVHKHYPKTFIRSESIVRNNTSDYTIWSKGVLVSHTRDTNKFHEESTLTIYTRISLYHTPRTIHTGDSKSRLYSCSPQPPKTLRVLRNFCEKFHPNTSCSDHCLVCSIVFQYPEE